MNKSAFQWTIYVKYICQRQTMNHRKCKFEQNWWVSLAVVFVFEKLFPTLIDTKQLRWKQTWSEGFEKLFLSQHIFHPVLLSSGCTFCFSRRNYLLSRKSFSLYFAQWNGGKPYNERKFHRLHWSRRFILIITLFWELSSLFTSVVTYSNYYFNESRSKQPFTTVTNNLIKTRVEL